MISIIAAIGENGELGKNNSLLWHLPADMKHFKEITSGHTVVMGQKTFESIGRALPNRRNIVLSQDLNFKGEKIEIVHSILEFQNLIKEKEEEFFIIGGGMIYNLFINFADKLYITHVEETFPDADTFFPEINENIWEKIKTEKFPKDSQNIYNLEFAEYIKKSS